VKLAIRRAEPADLDAIKALQAESVAWLASKGEDQWQPGHPRAPQDRPWSHLEASITSGTCWVAEHNGKVVATITVDDYADPDFWQPEEADEALYVHRMIVSRSHAGHDVGATLLTWADHLAQAANRPLLRLDAWRTNQALRRYYESQGFTHLRTIALPHRSSGAFRRVPEVLQLRSPSCLH
jgi:GNAT superfamily N-acetyltransferase